jgi:hypothetical protein
MAPAGPPLALPVVGGWAHLVGLDDPTWHALRPLGPYHITDPCHDARNTYTFEQSPPLVLY